MDSQRAAKALGRCVRGLARDRTVLLATQNLALLADVEVLIVVIRNGTIFEQGDYKTLVSMPTEFSRMLLISNRRDSDRARYRKQTVEGIPCPFLCYEDGPDPYDELFPQDKELAASDSSLMTASNTWNNFVTGDMWVSKRDHASSSGPNSAPWNTANMCTSQGAHGVVVRDGKYSTHGAHGAGAKAKARPVQRKRGERRQGFAFQAPEAQDIQDYFDSQRSAFSGGKPAKEDGHLNDLFAPIPIAEIREPGSRGGGVMPSVPSSAPKGGGLPLALPGGDNGDIDPGAESRRFPPNAESGEAAAPTPGALLPPAKGVRVAADAGGGVSALFERQMLQDGPPNEPEESVARLEEREDLFDDTAWPVMGMRGADIALNKHGAGGIGAASAIPTIGEDGVAPLIGVDVNAADAMAAGFHAASASSADFGFSLGASAADDPLPEVPAQASVSQPIAHDFEATAAAPANFLPDSTHSALPPDYDKKTKSKEERKDKGVDRSRRPDRKNPRPKVAKADGEARVQRVDVLERALKEKNDKIADLERRAASRGDLDAPNTTLVDETGIGAGATDLEAALARSDNAIASMANSELVRGSGGSARRAIVWLLQNGGLSSLVLSFLVVIAIMSHIGCAFLLSRMIIGVKYVAEEGIDAIGDSDGTTLAPIDDDIIWRGFETTRPATSTTVSTTLEVTTTQPAVVTSAEWNAGDIGHYCNEGSLSENDAPSSSLLFDPYFGWHASEKISLLQCQAQCEEFSEPWGCRYISWGGPKGSSRWCYIHRSCSPAALPSYNIHVLKVTVRPAARMLNATLEFNDRPIDEAQRRFDVILLCVVLSSLLVSIIAQAWIVVQVTLQGSQAASVHQLRALMAAPLSCLHDRKSVAAWVRDRLVCDVADADTLLPSHLSRALAAFIHIAATVLSVVLAGQRQVLLLVTLGVVLFLLLFIHSVRLPLGGQLRRLQTRTETAALLRAKHLASCNEILRTHGSLDATCNDFEMLCWDIALVRIAEDSANRWYQTRMQLFLSFLFGLLVFTLLASAQESGALEDFGGLAAAATALVHVALLPSAAQVAVKHSTSLHAGLMAISRMRKLRDALLPEELESPALRMRPPSKHERRDLDRVKNRGGHVVYGDVIVDGRGGPSSAEERAAALCDLARLEREQTVSVEGYSIERIADDWPYFGHVEFADVELRYGTGAPLAVQGTSLIVNAARATLLVGPGSAGKSSLLRSILRLAPLENGRVVVDGVDVRCVGLTTLRSRVAYVPQTTTLFRGSWRANLDPLGEFDDENLDLALRLSRLQQWLSQHAPKGLEEEIGQNGCEPDAAILALLGLCRALLRLLQKRGKLLVLDGTTCQLSTSSDADITAVLLRFCRRREIAVLQATRRLQNAPLYDFTAVMRGGRVLEQGPPRTLWAKDGELRALAREQGVGASTLTKPDAVKTRLASMWEWDVCPQEEPEWADEFEVGMRKQKTDKNKAADKQRV
eukprot:TRINITY_DN21768_c0_g4_i1.p1 TRINITY_DN21768_c0_g4~~TRINITY_DN21768_c0_g4_i1.p1  ORF type:complete len:1730 (-),score=231.12 TRINITY_DN21768_c0_g4_i1:254-4672(-)